MGAYILRPAQNLAGSLYLPYFPSVLIEVGTSRCSTYVVRPSGTVPVMLGQRSTPINVDFSSCIPVEEVVVVSVVSNPELLS